METLTLYMRPRCHLCDEMKAELVRLGYEIVEVDIDRDERAHRLYWLDIPVAVRQDGTVLARHRLPSRAGSDSPETIGPGPAGSP